MLVSIVTLIVDTAAGFLCFALLTRVIMQWARASFRNPLGQFTIAVTDWAVRPARRMIPSAWGIDLPSIVLAWLSQYLALSVVTALSGALGSAPGAYGVLALLALFDMLKIACYMLEAAVILSAVLSWVNPYAPMAPVLFAISQPLLRPFQRLIPPIGGVDLSPIALLLVLQVLLKLLDGLGGRLPMLLV